MCIDLFISLYYTEYRQKNIKIADVHALPIKE